MYYTSDHGDAALSSSPSPEFTLHSSPRGLARFPSPTSSTDMHADDAPYYLSSADAFSETSAGEGPYGPRAVSHLSLSYSPETPTGSYSSLLETSSLSGLSSSGHHSDSSQSSYSSVYRLMPPSHSPFADMAPLGPSPLFHPTESYHPMEHHMRSPVPFF